MTKENISLNQLLALIVNFLLGSSIVIGIANDAKNDAWISILLGGLAGSGIIWFYIQLLKRLPGKNIFEIMEFCLGRKISIILSFIYVVYFIYISCRVLRDFEELMSSALMPNTPTEVFAITFSLVMGFIVYLGIEILARTSEVFTPYLLGFIFLLVIFLFASGTIHLEQIRPFLGGGIMPILKTSFTQLIFFPFGELVVFTVILSNLTNTNHRLRISLIGVATATFLMTVSKIMQIISIDVDAIQRSNFPLLSAARNISIANFIERVDALVVFIILLGVLVKGSVYLFAGLKGLEHICHLPYRYFVLPVCMLISVFSIWVSIDFADHIKEGLQMVPIYLHLPLQFCFPILLFLVLLWKQRKTSS